jgi:hypothetical protein
MKIAKMINDVVGTGARGMAVLALAAAAMLADSPPARAGNGGAFVGGLVVGHVVGGFVRRDKARTQAELDRTYRAPPPPQPVYQQSVPVQTIQAAPPMKSVELKAA